MCKNRNSLLKKYRQIYLSEDILLEQLRIEHDKEPYTVKNYDKKKSNVCFILSCPGREELINNKPCSGNTGKNLNKLLQILHQQRPDLFKFTDRYQYDILNTTEIVHFEALDTETEGGKDEIDRGVKKILEYVDSNTNLAYMVLFGRKVKKIIKKLNYFIEEKNRVIYIIDGEYHLSYRGLSKINKDIKDNFINKKNYPKSDERTNARLTVVADKIIKQLN